MSPPPDQHDRDRAVHDDVRFIDAAAGSGKTATVVARIVRHIVVDGMAVERIAAATFTIAAAAELRARVRLALEGVRLWAADGGGEEPRDHVVAAVVARLPATAAAGAGQRAEDALARLDSAPWGTLHSLTLQAVRAVLPDVAVPAGLQLAVEGRAGAPDPAADLLGSQLWQPDWWQARAAHYPLAHPGPADALDAQLSLGDVAKMARRTAAELVGQGYMQAPADPRWHTDELLRRLRQTGEAVAAELRSLQADGLLRPRFADDIVELLRDLAHDYPEQLPGGADGPAGYHPGDTVAAAALVVSELPPASLLVRLSQSKINKPAKDGDFLGTRPEQGPALLLGGKVGKGLDRLHGQITGFKESIAGPDAALAFALLQQSVANAARLRDRRRAAGVLEFDDTIDLICSAWEPARGGDIPFDLVVIDEVQDSDPLQHRLLQVMAARGIPVVVVGDVRQSIYRFRGAEPRLFADLRDTAAAAALARLSTSFRHPRRLAQGLNELFAVPIGCRGVEPPEAMWMAQDSFDGPPVRVAVCPPAADAKNARRSEAGHVVAEILALRNADPAGFAWSDAAILMPTRASLPAIRAALQTHAIPFVVEAADLNWDTDGARGLAALLRARVSADRVALVGAALSPWVGLGLGDVAADDRSDDGLLNRLAARIAGVDIEYGADAATAVRRILAEFDAEGVVRGLAESGRGDLAQELLSDARFVLDQACDYVDNGGGGLAGFVADVIDADRTAPDARVKGASAGDHQDAVRITTIHAAKGLQYPHVLVAGLGNRGPADKFAIRWPRGSADPVAARVKKDLVAAPPGVAAKEVARELDERADEEADRLLYVALTRAERSATAFVRAPVAVGGSSVAGQGPVAEWLAGNQGKGKSPPAGQGPIAGVLWRRVRPLATAPRPGGDASEPVPGCLVIREALPAAEPGIREGGVPLQWGEPPPAVEVSLVPTVTGSRLHDAAVEEPHDPSPAAADGRDATTAGAGGVTASPEPVGQRVPAPDATNQPRTPAAARLGVWAAPESPARDESDNRGGKEFGTAVHAVVERCGLTGVDVRDADGPARVLAVASSLAPDGLHQAVSEAAVRVLSSEPLLQAADRGWRVEYEWPVLVPMSLQGRDIVGGGIIDIVVFRPDSVQIYDIKTDRIPAGGAAELAARYADQLRMYAEALRAVGSPPVTAAALLLASGTGPARVVPIALAEE